jgi:hypothetical protein
MIAYRPLRSEASVVSVHAMTANTRLIVLTINQTSHNAKLVLTIIITVTLTDSNDDENTNALTLTHALTIIIILLLSTSAIATATITAVLLLKALIASDNYASVFPKAVWSFSRPQKRR